MPVYNRTTKQSAKDKTTLKSSSPAVVTTEFGAAQSPLAPLQPLQMTAVLFHLVLSFVTVAGLAMAGLSCSWQTLLFTLVFHFACGFAYTGGYHRLWAHASYKATLPLRMVFAVLGSATFLGDILTWCQRHRAHHRHIDTDRDPFNINRGFFHAYLGSHLRRCNVDALADVSDLEKDSVVMFQHQFYTPLAVFFGWIFPAMVCGLGWHDFFGGFVIAGLARTFLFLHIQYLTRALCHVYGHQPYSVRTSARNNTWLSLLTLGENYLNFHYEFPSDYRLGVRYFHFDATKWMIRFLAAIGLAYDLRKMPLQDVLKVRVQRQHEKLDAMMKTLDFGPTENSLPTMTRRELEDRVAAGEILVILDNLVLNVEPFLSEHPGGASILSSRAGKDITIAFNGGVQRHSKAARNLSAMLRVAKLAE